MFNRILGLLLFILTFPIMIFIGVLIWIFSGWPVLFFQDRVGYKGKIFKIIKFRTMQKNADILKEQYRGLNEADGPVFKIRNDPRLTVIGKFLFHSGLDEMPQFINMIKGEMVLVGPRPLPTEEEGRINREFLKREKVKPGILSPWVLDGYHKMKFEDWMKSDLEYIKHKSKYNDFLIIIRGFGLMIKLFFREVWNLVWR